MEDSVVSTFETETTLIHKSLPAEMSRKVTFEH